MSRENFNDTRVLDEKTGKVHVVQTFDIPRYFGTIIGNCPMTCESTIDLIKEECKIWCKRGDYTFLSNVEFEPTEDGSLEDDLKAFQDMLDEKFGKDVYEAFVLGAYIHSSTVFSINKTGNHVCQYDSSQLGFIGLYNEPKETTEHNYIASEARQVAEELNAAWNGEFMDYMVTDALTGEVVDELLSYDYDTNREFVKNCKEKYDIDFDELEIKY